MTLRDQTDRRQVATDPIVFGPGPGLLLQTISTTPYLAIRDVNGAPIIALGVTAEGFVVHRAEGVKDGDPLQQANDHGMAR